MNSASMGRGPRWSLFGGSRLVGVRLLRTLRPTSGPFRALGPDHSWLQGPERHGNGDQERDQDRRNNQKNLTARHRSPRNVATGDKGYMLGTSPVRDNYPGNL